LLSKFGYDELKPVRLPIDENAKVLPSVQKTTDDSIHHFQEQICSLMYLVMTTRADIASAVGILSRFFHNPNDGHFCLIKRIFRYLSGLGTKGIRFPSKNDLMVQALSDSNWAGDLDQRKSTSEVLVMMECPQYVFGV
jgi:hypothetical protein